MSAKVDPNLEVSLQGHYAGGVSRLVAFVTDMFLGDRRENLFKLGALRLRCYGKTSGGGTAWLELPPDDLWIFPAPRT